MGLDFHCISNAGQDRLPSCWDTVTHSISY